MPPRAHRGSGTRGTQTETSRSESLAACAEHRPASPACVCGVVAAPAAAARRRPVHKPKSAFFASLRHSCLHRGPTQFGLWAKGPVVIRGRAVEKDSRRTFGLSGAALKKNFSGRNRRTRATAPTRPDEPTAHRSAQARPQKPRTQQPPTTPTQPLARPPLLSSPQPTRSRRRLRWR